MNVVFFPLISSHPGQIHQREQEIAELKQKIAEVMAVMPSLSYSSDGSNLSPVTPHYSSKFMDNSPSSLDPNASVYQPLKKWLWHPRLSDGTFPLFWSQFWFRVILYYFRAYKAPESFCTFNTHTQTHTAPPYIWVFALGVFYLIFFVLFILGGVEFCLFVLFGLFLVLRVVFLDLAIRQRDLFEGWRKEQTLFGQMYWRAIMHRFVSVFF